MFLSTANQKIFGTKNIKYLFITCTARGGGNLVARMISSHDQVNIAVDPFLEIFKLARNKLLNKEKPCTLRKSIPDYFYNKGFLNYYKKLTRKSLDIKTDKDNYRAFFERHKLRLDLQCNELIKFIPKKPILNIKHLLEVSLHSIQKSRFPKTGNILGIKDSWIIELFPALAKTFKNAKFILVVRDPRACISSNYSLKSKNIKANSCSFVRSWRKNIAFLSELESDPKIKERIHLIKYEDLITRPKITAKKIFKFLELPFRQKVLDPKNYFDYSKNIPWTSNSSFSVKKQKIYKSSLDRWKKVLPFNLLCLVEIISYPELRLLGYRPTTNVHKKANINAAIRYIINEKNKGTGWSSNNNLADEIKKIKLDYNKNFYKTGDNLQKFLFLSHYKKIIPFLKNPTGRANE